MKNVEQRESPRTVFGIILKIEDATGGHFHGRTVDVSAGGSLIDCSRPFPIGSRLTLEIADDNSDLGRIHAEVKRCAPAFGGRRHTVAVQFESSNSALVAVVESKHRRREGRAC